MFNYFILPSIFPTDLSSVCVLRLHCSIYYWPTVCAHMQIILKVMPPFTSVETTTDPESTVALFSKFAATRHYSSARSPLLAARFHTGESVCRVHENLR